MKNHYYTYNNTIRKQSKGGAIGNSLTQRMGQLLMKRFDKKNNTLLKKLKIKTELSKTFVDDNMTALKALDPGVRFDEDKVKMVMIPELVESDLEVAEDTRTMEELKKIANTVYKCLQFTTDSPSIHQGGMMPVLDLQMYVGKDGLVKYEFYKKPCASQLTIPARSAHSKQQKLSVMVEEGLRRLRNHSRGLEWEKRKVCMEDWARKLQKSGYPPTFRHQVVKAAVEKWEKMCRDEDAGLRPIHRAREWQLKARRLEKETKRESWYKVEGDKISAPLIISPTAGSLTSEIKAVCDRYTKSTNIKVATRTRAGQPLRGDPKSEPFRRIGCRRESCLVCSSGKPGQCERNGSGYRIICTPCLDSGKKAIYEGETGRNCYSRGLEHQDNLSKELDDSPLWKHCSLEHGGEKVQFTMKALRSYRSCLMRQVNEPVRILSSKADMLLNSKNEFHQAPLTRLVAVSGLQGSQGENETAACRMAGRAATVGAGSQGRGVGGAGRGRGSVAGRGRRAPGTT